MKHNLKPALGRQPCMHERGCRQRAKEETSSGYELLTTPQSVSSHLLRYQMCTVVLTSWLPVALHQRQQPSFIKPSLLRRASFAGPNSPRQLAVASNAFSTTLSTEDSRALKGLGDGGVKQVELLACPICFEPLQRAGPAGYTQAAIMASTFSCERCRRAFPNNSPFLDLTVTSGSGSYEEGAQPTTEMFRNPLVSFAYERGWRQSFYIFGYPGPDEELKMAEHYMKSAVGKVLVDVSCASGILTRRFVKSGQFSSVYAVDFSENMLKEFGTYVNQDAILKQSYLVLVRADVGRLPFATGTIDAVNAGAAIHCWPSPSNGVAEISRILKPGGIFVASTQVLDVIKPMKQVLSQTSGYRGASSEAELRDLCTSCGLVNWSRIRRLAFIMFTAQKPI